jgi:hypothetical protein
MDTNAVLDLMWVVCGILVFSCKRFHTCETGFQDQKTLEYNNENLMDFASVLSDFGLSVTLSCTEILLDLYRNPNFFLIALQICTVCFFQTVFAATANNCIRGNRRKNKIFNIPYLFFDDDRFYLPNFWALGLARRRLVN